MNKSILIFAVLFLVSGVLAQNFTIVVTSDTEKYTRNNESLKDFEAQYDWINNNIESLNIKLVYHLGDIIEEPHNETHWIWANQTMSRLNETIPLIIAPGNHEVDNYTLYDIYFNRTHSNYTILNIYNRSYGFLNIEWNATVEVLNWSRDIVLNNSNTTWILGTHEYFRGREDIVAKFDNLLNQTNISYAFSGDNPYEEKDWDVYDNRTFRGLSDFEIVLEGRFVYYTFFPELNITEGYVYSPKLNSTTQKMIFNENDMSIEIINPYPVVEVKEEPKPEVKSNNGGGGNGMNAIPRLTEFDSNKSEIISVPDYISLTIEGYYSNELEMCLMKI